MDADIQFAQALREEFLKFGCPRRALGLVQLTSKFFEMIWRVGEECIGKVICGRLERSAEAAVAGIPVRLPVRGRMTGRLRGRRRRTRRRRARGVGLAVLFLPLFFSLSPFFSGRNCN